MENLARVGTAKMAMVLIVAAYAVGSVENETFEVLLQTLSF